MANATEIAIDVLPVGIPALGLTAGTLFATGNNPATGLSTLFTIDATGATAIIGADRDRNGHGTASVPNR